MSFIADKQTLEDLNLLGKFKQNSVFSLFNKMETRGGERLLETMFKEPMTNAHVINERSRVFAYFQTKDLQFPISKDEFAVVADYLDSAGDQNLILAGFNMLTKKILSYTVKDERFQQMQSGLKFSIKVLKQLITFVDGLQAEENVAGPYASQLSALKAILGHKVLNFLQEAENGEAMPLLKLVRLDYILRQVLREEMMQLITIIYELDVFLAVSRAAALHGFSYAQALPKSNSSTLDVKDFRHPCIKGAVGNSLSLNEESNVLFLTGANMAGKSTLMKSFGINFYLAHMGFPVAAKEMIFSLKDGLYSSINVSDNLELGMSHFYAEVLRVKRVAEAVRDDKDLLVIFDELFKGTNVKDAYDATLAVTEAFAENRNCFFVISTHIIEVGEVLEQHCQNIQFAFLPTVMKGAVPHYPYLLSKGITSDRHGMLIIENEGIMDILLGV